MGLTIQFIDYYKKFLLSIVIGLFIGQALLGQKACFEKTEFHNPTIHQNLEKFTTYWLKNKDQLAQSRGAITIPVVVHIVYQSEAENFSDEQIQTQIAALNRDFNLENTNLDQVHADFRDLIGRVDFNFCLSNRDPNGIPTNGITRTQTNEDFEFFAGASWIYYTNQGGKDAWPTDQYLNIWVTKGSGNALGFGSKPGQNKETEDGVIIASQYFGQTPPFHLGRTLTHEVGHYFNLFHPWGNKNDCTGDDFVRDTPPQGVSYFGCPDQTSVSCGSHDITANFMNNSDDACLAMFTHGQINRMQAALIGARRSLLDSPGCAMPISNNPIEAIKIYPNPASYYFCIETGDLSAEIIRLRILDSRGAMVQNEMVVESNHLAYFEPKYDGIYFLQFLIGEKETITQKVIILR